MLPADEASDRLFLNMPKYAKGATDVVLAEELSRAAENLSGAAELAVDAEMDSMHAFRPRLCFLQIATDQEVFLLDALSPEVRLEALAALFADPERPKYFHAAASDLQYLAERGIRVKGLFDTHRAATLLGWPKIGLADLARERLQVELPKEHQQADFSIRPLPTEVRQYIADDVRYLCELGRQLREECRKAGILEEVELDCQRLADEALSPPEIGADYKVKLSRPALSAGERALGTAIALALHQLRLKWAEAADVPFGRVLSNSAVGEIAIRRPSTLRELAKTPFVRNPFVREHGEEVLATVRELMLRSGKGELPIANQPARLEGAQRKREELLRKYRAEKAGERKVTQSVVLSNALVSDLARAGPRNLEELARVPYLGDKRLRLYGRELLQLLGTTD
jgi:ribonuclease D